VAGIAYNLASLQQQAGQALISLRDALTAVQQQVVWLGSFQDADLLTMGMSQDDLTATRAAYTDMALLVKVVQGLAPVPAAYDFRQNTIKLTGGY
jgi:hypothetical protein